MRLNLTNCCHVILYNIILNYFIDYGTGEHAAIAACMTLVIQNFELDGSTYLDGIVDLFIYFYSSIYFYNKKEVEKKSDEDGTGRIGIFLS